MKNTRTIYGINYKKLGSKRNEVKSKNRLLVYNFKIKTNNNKKTIEFAKVHALVLESHNRFHKAISKMFTSRKSLSRFFNVISACNYNFIVRDRNTHLFFTRQGYRTKHIKYYHH